MRSYCLSLFAALAATTGCHPQRYTETDEDGNVHVVSPLSSDDSNEDGVLDADQSIGVGYDGNEPYVIFFSGPQLPPYQNNLNWIGFGCSMYDGDGSDDWLKPCAPLSTYSVDGKQVGFAFANVREGVHEGDVVDADNFVPGGGGWADPAAGQTAEDDPSFFVRHVNGPSCPIDGQSTTTLYGFVRVGDEIEGLGESVAPPDPACN